MKLRSPLGLFFGITLAGLPLAIGTGQAIGIHYTNYEPIPQPSQSGEPWSDWQMGNRTPDPGSRPTLDTKGRVASESPKPSKSNKVTRPKAVEQNSTRTQIQEEPSGAPTTTAPPLTGSCMRVCPTDENHQEGGAGEQEDAVTDDGADKQDVGDGSNPGTQAGPTPGAAQGN